MKSVSRSETAGFVKSRAKSVPTLTVAIATNYYAAPTAASRQAHMTTAEPQLAATQAAKGESLWENPLGTDGFEFVEYTAPNAADLGRLFESMGFSRVA